MEIGASLYYRETSTSAWDLLTIQHLETNPRTLTSVLHLSNGKVLEVDMEMLRHDTCENLKLPNDASFNAVKDLTELEYLNEPSILHVLQAKYHHQQIYVFTSPKILIAINPFQPVPHLYTPEAIESYLSQRNAAPHVYYIADQAYQQLADMNQTILVSGESGSGKTETLKHLMKYLTQIAATAVEAHEAHDRKEQIMTHLLASSPILEAFGNAATSCNPNSSRFGKFVQMQFTSNGAFQSARIHVYLLEKVRLSCAFASGSRQRNFHVFYQLLYGSSQAQKQQFNLSAQDDAYHYLANKPLTTVLEREASACAFQQLQQAMTTIGLESQDQDYVFQTVSTVLLLGNLDFEAIQAEKSHQNGCRFTAKTKQEAGAHLALHFKLSLEQFERIFCHTQLEIQDESFELANDRANGQVVRDGLAKYLYYQLVLYLIAKLNTSIGLEAHKSDPSTKWIGMLDLFGFEDIHANAFEQLCINYANETFQHLFLNQVLDAEQQYYQEEQITWHHISFTSNLTCLETLEGAKGKRTPRKFGVFELLNEQCHLPHGTDLSLGNNLHRLYLKAQEQEIPTALFVSKRNQGAVQFQILHYTGYVEYSCHGMCEKNKDKLNKQTLIQLLQDHEGSSSQLRFYRDLLQVEDIAKTKSKKPSLINEFQSQLRDLTQTIDATNCSYIRCFKPNDANLPNQFCMEKIAAQFRATGMIQAVEMAQQGYPIRLTFPEFHQRYQFFLKSIRKCPHGDSTRQHYTNIVQELTKVFPELEQVQVGLTKVFFTRASSRAIEHALKYQSSTRLQAIWRRYKHQQGYQKQRAAIIHLQALARGHQARRAVRVRFPRKQELVPQEEIRSTVVRVNPRGMHFQLQDDHNSIASRSSSSMTSSISITKEPGDTVLHLAVKCCKEQDVRALLASSEAIKHVNAQNANGRSALHIAALHRHAGIVKALLGAGAKTDMMDNDGNTALNLTIDPIVVRLLMKANANPNLPNENGDTILLSAAEHGHLRILTILGDFNITNLSLTNLRHDQNALMLAIRKGHYECVYCLLKLDERRSTNLLTQVDRNRNNVLHFAAARSVSKRSIKLVQTLIEYAHKSNQTLLDIDQVNRHELTPLCVHILASKSTNTANVQAFLEADANPNTQLTEGSSILHAAIQNKQYQVAAMLVRYGADLNARNRDGQYAVELAERSKWKLLCLEIQRPPTWIPDEERMACMLCKVSFKLGTRRHHCRHCSRICCSTCSPNAIELHHFPAAFTERSTIVGKRIKGPQRVCKTCSSVFHTRMSRQHPEELFDLDNDETAKYRKSVSTRASAFLGRILGYEEVEIPY